MGNSILRLLAPVNLRDRDVEADAKAREAAIGLALDAASGEHTKRAYQRDLTDFLSW